MRSWLDITLRSGDQPVLNGGGYRDGDDGDGGGGDDDGSDTTEDGSSMSFTMPCYNLMHVY